MNILLINPLCRLPYLLPLGLGYIASVLRQDGHRVDILDINAYSYSNDKVEEIIKGLRFDIAGVGGLTSTYKYVKWLSGVIKKDHPDKPLIAGNMVATAHPELLLKNSKVDIAVIDEGEVTFRELGSVLANNGDLNKVDGIYFKEGERIVATKPRARITDLDSLPFPAWDLFPMEIYLGNSTWSHSCFNKRQINISSERGCPYECTFCSHPFGRTVYTRSAGSMQAEIKELKKRYGVQYINFSDDLFLLNEKRVLAFCDLMIKDDIGIKWSASGRVNLVNDELLSMMKRAGCVELSYGFESGSQALLDGMNKRVSVKQAEEAIRITRNAGIDVSGSFIFGMPGETRETIKATLEFIKRTRLPVYRFFYATPYPKTELYETAKRMGRLPGDEDRYIESLGEMRTTFLVNLTQFSDGELVRLKKLSEKTARNSLGLGFRLKEFIEEWQQRFLIIGRDIKKEGFFSAIGTILCKVRCKLRYE